MLKVSESRDGVTIAVHVQPKASRNEICGIRGDELRIRLTAAPVDDAANRLCVEFLAKKLGVPKSSMAIIGGEKSRHKTIRVTGISGETVRNVLTGATMTQDNPA